MLRHYWRDEIVRCEIVGTSALGSEADISFCAEQLLSIRECNCLDNACW
jgi:hypothetical protein